MQKFMKDLKEKRVAIRLSTDEYKRLTMTARENNMTVAEYVRDILAKQSAVTITIDFADIDTYIEKVDAVIRRLDAVLPTIFRSGKALESEAVEIKKIANSFNDLSGQIWRYVVKTRQDLYDDTRKQLYATIKANRYKRRRRTDVHPVADLPEEPEDLTNTNNPYQE